MFGATKLVEAIVQTGLSDSLSEAKRLIRSGGISVFGNKITDLDYQLLPQDSLHGFVLVQKGKKNHSLIVFPT